LGLRYNAYATPMARESFDPVKERYSIAAPPQASEPAFVAKKASSHVFAAPSARPAPRPAPHFMDHEANLRAQQAASSSYLEAKANFPPPSGESWAVDRVVGFRPAPWKDRPFG
jgi:hypothetical protein